MKENKDIKQAKEEFDLISRDDTLRWLALRANMAKSEEAQLIEDARENGLEEGEKKSKLEIAKNMIKENIDIDIIEKVTGLTREEIKKL